MSNDINLNLHEVLQHGYTNDKNKQAEWAGKHGYKLDGDLSNDNHQIYYHEKGNKLLHNINGTQNKNLNKAIKDWGTNVYIGAGGIKNTDRYREEKEALDKAKIKYKPQEITFTGHSMGGGHASQLQKENKGSKAFTYNKATSILFSPPKDKNGETHFRALLDPVSIRTADLKSLKNTVTFNPFQSALQAHALDNLKDTTIKV
jgi:hypothetical protein